MPRRTNRRTFLKGTAGAVGMGAVGALSSKLELGAMSLSANTQPAVVEIEVYLVKNGGTKRGKSVLAPGAEASPGDTVIWKAMTSTIKRIQRVHFKDSPNGFPNPFSKTNANIPNPNPAADKNMNKGVLGDADMGQYNYRISVQDVDGPVYKSDDPPLDIVPRGN